MRAARGQSTPQTVQPPPDLEDATEYYGVHKARRADLAGVYTKWHGRGGAREATKGVKWDLRKFSTFHDALLYAKLGKDAFDQLMEEQEREARGERIFVSTQEIEASAQEATDSLVNTFSQVSIGTPKKSASLKGQTDKGLTSISSSTTSRVQAPNVSIHINVDTPKKKGKAVNKRRLKVEVGFWTNQALILGGWDDDEVVEKLEAVVAAADDLDELREGIHDLFDKYQGAFDGLVEALVKFVQLDGSDAAPTF